MSQLTLRYALPDEPRPTLLSRFAVPPFFVLPVTIYLALVYSPLLWMLPGVNSLLIGGHGKWRGVGLSVLALVLFVVLTVMVWLLADKGLLSGLALGYAKDLAIAGPVLPLLFVMNDQERIRALRRLQDQ